MEQPVADEALAAARQHGVSLPAGTAASIVVEAIPREASVVLLGEASHGTHEFYALRALVTQELIDSRGFSLVAVEAGWPDAYRVNQWVRQHGGDAAAETVLDDFTRFSPPDVTARATLRFTEGEPRWRSARGRRGCATHTRGCVHRT